MSTNQAFRVVAAVILGLYLLTPLSQAKINCEDTFAAVTEDWIATQLKAADSRDPIRQQIDTNARAMGVLASSVNAEIVRQHNTRYSLKLPTGRTTDQKNSGRCWMFAGLNMIRAKALAAGILPPEFEFSANYLYFFNFLEQANLGVEQALNALSAKSPKDAKRDVRDAISNISDGGYFHQFEFLISKYGLVPKSAMPETAASQNPNSLIGELQRIVARGLETLRKEKAGKPLSAEERLAARDKILSEVFAALVTYLGRPPTEFEIPADVKNQVDKEAGTISIDHSLIQFTPREFAEVVVKFDPSDFVLVVTHSGFERGKSYFVEDERFAVSGGGTRDKGMRYLNVAPERLQELTEASLSAGIPVYFAMEMDARLIGPEGIIHPAVFRPHVVHGQADTSHNGLPRDTRIFYFGGWAEHAMMIRGMDKTDADRPARKFLVENSWGPEAGDKGELHLYAEGLREFVHMVVVPRSVLNDGEIAAWSQPPTGVTARQIRQASKRP